MLERRNISKEAVGPVGDFSRQSMAMPRSGFLSHLPDAYGDSSEKEGNLSNTPEQRGQASKSEEKKESCRQPHEPRRVYPKRALAPLLKSAESGCGGVDLL